MCMWELPNDFPWPPAPRTAQAQQATPDPGNEGSAHRQDLTRGSREGSEEQRGHAQRDPSSPGAERSVRGRDTGTARLLIGRRRAERGGVGAARALRRAAWRACNGR